MTRQNEDVKELIWQGWTPLFGAMVISSATGIVLDTFVSKFEDFALLAVAISGMTNLSKLTRNVFTHVDICMTGLPGSVGAILISRLSTALHTVASTPHNPSFPPISKDDQPLSTRFVMVVLFLVTLPVEVILLSILKAIGWLSLGFGMIAAAAIGFCFAVRLPSHFHSIHLLTSAGAIARYRFPSRSLLPAR